ncbi:MAG TPA: hypothetical protein VIG69_04680, partial [Candidatus Methylomirabilis sp.]
MPAQPGVSMPAPGPHPGPDGAGPAEAPASGASPGRGAAGPPVGGGMAAAGCCALPVFKSNWTRTSFFVP